MSLVASLFRSTERRAAQSLSEEQLIKLLSGGSASSSGVTVNRSTVMTHAAVWRAISGMAFDIAKMPVKVYRTEGAGKEPDRTHPAYGLLRHRANAEMKSFDFKVVIVGHALLKGNGYAYIVRGSGGAAEELIPLDPDYVTPERIGGRLVYSYTSHDKRIALRRIDASSIFHVKGLSYDGLVGYSPLQLMKESVGVGLAARKYISKFFGNGARPSAVLEHPGKIGTEGQERLRKSWNEMHQGLENVHKVAILEEGMKLNPFSMSMVDAQMMELRKFDVREIANWFGIPPHFLGDDTRTSHNSLEQESQSYLDRGLDPWLTAFEEEAEDKLLTERERLDDTHTIEFNRAAAVRSNIDARANYYQKALAGGPWMTPDEVRRLENMNDLEDGAGSQYIVPLNLRTPDPAPGTVPAPAGDAPADTSGGGGGPPDAGRSATPPGAARLDVEAASAQVVKVAQDVAGRMARRLGQHIRRAAKNPATFGAALESIERDHGHVVRDAIEPVVGLSLRLNAAAWSDDAALALRERVVSEMVRAIHAAADDAYTNSPRSAFAAAIETAMDGAERDAAAAAVSMITKRTPDGDTPEPKQ